MTKLPKHYRKYFWDCQFEELTLEKYAFFVVERLLTYGNVGTTKWLLDRIDSKSLKSIVSKSRNLDNKTKNYWELMLG